MHQDALFLSTGTVYVQLKSVGTRKTEVARHKGSEVEKEIVSSCSMREKFNYAFLPRENLQVKRETVYFILERSLMLLLMQ